MLILFSLYEADLLNQKQIDDTVNVMRQNIQRTSERGTHVVDLGTRADGMEEHAKQFNRGANRAMKNLRMKNWRMGAWIGLAIVIIVIIAIAIGLPARSCLPILS